MVQKSVKIKGNKISYRENISLSEKENTNLITEYGEKAVAELYDYLSAYKIEKSYKTKSDYLTIKRWVVDAVKKQNKTVFSQNGNTYQNQLEAARKAFKPLSEV